MKEKEKEDVMENSKKERRIQKKERDERRGERRDGRRSEVLIIDLHRVLIPAER